MCSTYLNYLRALNGFPLPVSHTVIVSASQAGELVCSLMCLCKPSSMSPLSVPTASAASPFWTLPGCLRFLILLVFNQIPDPSPAPHVSQPTVSLFHHVLKDL